MRYAKKLSQKELGLLLTVFIFGIFLYTRTLAFPSGDPYGDEAWYYYISKTIYWNWDPHLFLVPPIRWGFIVIMHPFTKSLFTFRIAHILISFIPLIIFFYLSYRYRSIFPLFAALLYVTNDIILFYTGHVFTTLLAGVFALFSLFLNYYCPSSRKRICELVSAFTLVIAVGIWEAILFIPLALLLSKLVNREYNLSFSSISISLLLIFAIILSIITSYDNIILGYPPPGWSYSPLKLEHIYYLSDHLKAFLLLLISPSLSELIVCYSMMTGLLSVALIRGTALMNWYYIPAYMIYYFFLAKWSLDIVRGRDTLLSRLIEKVHIFRHHRHSLNSISSKVGLNKVLVVIVTIFYLLNIVNYYPGIKLQTSYTTCCNDACLLTLRNILWSQDIKPIVMYKEFWAYPYFISLIYTTKPPSQNLFKSHPCCVFSCYNVDCLANAIKQSKAIIMNLKYYHNPEIRKLLSKWMSTNQTIQIKCNDKILITIK